jgi:DNA polymerase-4
MTEVSEPSHRCILHVDMDAFFASVEVLDDPSLAGKAVVVGGTGRRGVVASCTYEARIYGIRSAMPTARARQLCPHAVFLDGRHGRYEEVSRALHALLGQYTPLVEGVSLDEAFLDVTGAWRLHGSGAQIAENIRRRVRAELGLSCSVGVAPVKFLAKLASEAAKPRASRQGVVPGPGVVVVAPGQELAFLHPHRIEALWGVGPATARRLRAIGISTVGELAAVPQNTLEQVLGRAHGAHLAQLARGLDPRPVEPQRALKSVSHEETYPFDRHRLDELRPELARMADSVATRLRKAGVAGRTVTVKVRDGAFNTRTRSRTFASLLADGPSISSIAQALLEEMDLSRGVRLLGIGVSNLSVRAGAEQLSLGGDESRSRRCATEALDAVRERFGEASVGPLALLKPGRGLAVKRRGDQQWGPGGGEQVSYNQMLWMLDPLKGATYPPS